MELVNWILLLVFFFWFFSNWKIFGVSIYLLEIVECDGGFDLGFLIIFFSLIIGLILFFLGI